MGNQAIDQLRTRPFVTLLEKHQSDSYEQDSPLPLPVKVDKKSEKPPRIPFAMALTHFIYTFKQNDTHALIH